MIEGSGSIPLTNGSGSGRPKNMWIRWIRIRIRIRNSGKNTIAAFFCYFLYYFILCVDRHIPSLVLPIAEIPYTVNGKKVELAVKKILAGQQVVHFLTFFLLLIDLIVYG